MTASLAEPTEQAAREELWISFRSLLQVYLAAGSIGGSPDVPQALVHERQPHQLHIIGLTHTVQLEWKPETGEGYWVIHEQPSTGATALDERTLGTAGMLDEGAFRLHLDGEFDWSGKPGRLGMDAVAEALAVLVLSGPGEGPKQ